MLNGALHYSTGTKRFQTFASSHALYHLILLSKYFKCILGTLRFLEVSKMFWEFGSNPELSISPERGGCRVK